MSVYDEECSNAIGDLAVAARRGVLITIRATGWGHRVRIEDYRRFAEATESDIVVAIRKACVAWAAGGSKP